MRSCMRGDDGVFGLGVGCEGALRILIQPLTAEAGYEPFASLLDTLDREPFADLSLVQGDNDLGVTRVLAPLRLLILGAGQDAEPLLMFAAALGWEVSVSDHRSESLQRFNGNSAAAVECVPAADLASHFELARFDAVIVMSHNLQADRTYLRALAASAVEYVGLLGPRHRRDRLLRE